MSKGELQGHILSVITVIFWGTTFISTKVLLIDFTPVEILFFRFSIGSIALVFAYPHILKWTGIKREIMFMCSGILGVTLYFLLENIALTLTHTANVSIIVATSPFFVAIVSRIITKEKNLHLNFFIGFVFAIFGIALISFSGSGSISVNPLGDILSLLAAIVWAFYCVFTREIGRYGYNPVQATRRTFLYGLLFMLPTLTFFEFDASLAFFANPKNLFNMLYLGVGASALCFVTWNSAIKLLGTVKTSAYIYAVPVIAIISSSIILKEPITSTVIIGTVLTLTGLIISQYRSKSKSLCQE